MTVSKQQFMSRPKIKGLPAAEKERRWKQHLMSEGGLTINRNQVHGRGNYFSSARAWADRQLKKIPKGTFGKIGGAMAGPVGQTAGELIAQLTGRGDYMINKNSLIEDGAMLKPSQMSFAPTGSASIRIRKREFIADLVAPDDPVAFTQTQYRLQPTDGKTFPWLSAVAEHFTEWELHGAILTYETTSSNYAQNMALGTVSMATQYNANESPYTSMREILQAAYHSRGNPSESIMHGIECDPALQASEHLFTRRFGTSGPPNLYDHGVVTVATEGLPAQAGTVLGRLFITYDVELNLSCLPTAGNFAGRCATTWSSVASTTTPPMGDPLTITSVNTTSDRLTYGTSVGNNVMALLPSNGPWARPNLPAEQQGSLVAWVSDSTVTAGLQYVSFANPGNYLMEFNLYAATGDNPQQAISVSDLTPDITTDTYYTTFNGVPFANTCQTYFRIHIECDSPDQSISLLRLNASNFATWTVLTVC